MNPMEQEFVCSQEGCHFSVHSDDEGEIIHFVREHNENKHGMSVSDTDVRKGMHAA